MVWIILFGGICASFMVAVTEAKHLNILYRRSRCDSCHHTLTWMELIPVASFVLLKGKCSQCKSNIDIGSFICELLLIFFYLLPIFYDLSLKDLTLYYLMITILIPVALNDFKTFTIPNHMSLLFLFTGLFLTDLQYIEPFKDIVIILILHLFYLLFSDSVGYGDIKLFTVITLITPVNFFVYTILLTYIIGGLFIIILHFYKSDMPRKIPLVPFITNALILAFILYEEINTIYFGGFL
ncbi:A24 family peptidase [Salinicoccus sp. RF5]|uniref:prepilin peptidase n=1 Tax=Salinicoccus sp. RF5 TaxID=2748874 RepID=UPI001E587E3F|nr:A24 family peptidase [Salinicoccus sp. RF5]MCC4721955.1 prepilin peptidase [Salinicoccus sp. RF5]